MSQRYRDEPLSSLYFLPPPNVIRNFRLLENIYIDLYRPSILSKDKEDRDEMINFRNRSIYSRSANVTEMNLPLFSPPLLM